MPPSNEPRIEIGIRLDLDSFSRDKNRLLGELRGLSGQTIDIGTNIDIGDLAAAETLIRGLGGDIGIRLNVEGDSLTTLQSTLDGLDTTVNVRVSASDSDIQEVSRDIQGLSETVNVRVNADAGELDTVESQLADIQESSIINVVFNVGSAGLGAVSGLIDTFGDISGIGGLFEMNTLMTELEATTGRIIPGAEKLINDLFISGWGESRTQIAGVVEEATNLGIAFEKVPGAVESALRLVAVNGEYTTKEYLRTQEQLVQNGIVDTYTEAADLIVAGFQNGVDAQDDWLDTLFEYAPDFADLGLTGEQMVNAIVGGIGAGFRNSDMPADALREFQTKLITEFENPDFQDALEQIGQLDDAELFKNGEISGAQLLSGVTGAIQTLLDSGEIDLANQLASTLFGTQADDIGARGIAAMDPFVKHIDTEIPGAATRASDAMSTTITAMLDRLKRVISDGIATELDSAFDISARIEDAQAGADAFFSALDGGAELGTAAGIGLKIAGLDELEQSLAGFIFDLLTGLSDFLGFLDGIPGVDIDTDGLDAAIAKLAGGQLEIELLAAGDASEVSEAVQNAIGRGVNADDAIAQVGDGLQAALGAGATDTARGLNDYLLSLQEAQSQTGEFDSERLRGFQEYVDGLSELDFNQSEIDGFLSDAGISDEEIESFRAYQTIGEELSTVDLSNLTVDFTDIDTDEIMTALEGFDITEAFDIASALDPAALAAVFAQAAAEGNDQLTTLLAPLAEQTAREGFVGLNVSGEDRAAAADLIETLDLLEEQSAEMATATTESLALFGSSADLAAQEVDAAGVLIRGGFDETIAASAILEGAGVTGSAAFSEAWNLALDGANISLALFSGSVVGAQSDLQAFILGVNSSLSGGAAFSGSGGAGGSATTVNNNTTVNAQFNNNSAAASSNATASVAQSLAGG